MGIYKKRLILSFILDTLLIVGIAAGWHYFSAQDDTKLTGEVTNSSVEFNSGEQVESAQVTVNTEDGDIQAAAPTGDVPQAGETVVLVEEDGSHSLNSQPVWLHYPITYGLPITVGIALLFGGFTTALTAYLGQRNQEKRNVSSREKVVP